jgi:hypothetical protein
MRGGSIVGRASLMVVICAAALELTPAAGATTTQPCPPALSTVLTSPPSESATGPAPPAAAPQQVVVCIGLEPISGATLEHWTAVAEKAEARAGRTAATRESMAFLISGDWVLDEARDLGVQVSELEVRHNFDHIRAQQFHTRREFRAFLRSSGQTVADLLFRTRLNLTSERIQRHFLSGHAGAKSKAEALARFVAGFKRKWKAQTYCAAAYAVGDCGRVF